MTYRGLCERTDFDQISMIETKTKLGREYQKTFPVCLAILCSIVSKAALMSRDTKTEEEPWSAEWRILSRVRINAVSVE